MKKSPNKKKQYRSPESRARQLAGLNGVKISDHVHGCDHIQKVNGKGAFASISEEQRKHIIELYCQGFSLRAIEEKTGFGRQTLDDVKRYALDHDSQFRNQMFQQSLREKLQTVVSGAADRVTELIPEMSAKDSVLALGIAYDKLASMDRSKTGETLHQHVHLHTSAQVTDEFVNAMKPVKEIQNND